MTQPHLEKIFYNYIRKDPVKLEIVETSFFTNPVLQELLKVDKKWYKKYTQIPSTSNMIEALRQAKNEDITSDEVKVVLESKLDDYDEVWLKENAEAWIELKQLNLSFLDGISLVKGVEITPDNIKSIVASVKEIFLTRNSIDFSFNTGIDFFDADSHIQLESDTFTTGYPFLDTCLDGGWEIGSLVAFMAPPKTGKSTILCNIAAQSIQLGYNTLYITLEMSDKKIAKRIGANTFDIPMKEYNEVVKNKAYIKEKLKEIGQQNLKIPGKLFIKQYPASSAGVPDIENYIRKMEETTQTKFTVVIIDYINIMKNWRNPNTENTFMKIKQICEDLRAMATRLKFTCISATQTGRCLALDTEVTEKNKGKIQIKDLKINDEILSHVGFTKVKKIYETEVKKVYLIKTKSGKTIKCSAEHIFPLANGIYKTAYDLDLQDKLLTIK